MPFRYKILSEHRVIVAQYTGEMGPKDVIENIQKLRLDPLYEESHNGIVDLRRAVTGGGPEDVSRLIHFLRSNSANTGRWAAVFSDPKLLALGMIFKTFKAERPRLEVFSTWEAACFHIRIDLPENIFDSE